MEKLTRRRYTLEYKQEAVGLVSSGQKVSSAAKALGIVEQTLANWVKAEKSGRLRGVKSEQVSADRMEIKRMRQSKPRLAASVGVRSDSCWMDLFASPGRMFAR